MVTVLAVADTDSYLKWSRSTLAALADAHAVQVVLANPVMPSPAQRAAAGAGDASVVDRRGLGRLVRRLRPDAVLLACTGPVVATLLDSGWARRADRPVLVTGLPGISVPATRRALRFRAGCDLFVLHSRREVAEFAALAAAGDRPMAFGLARLPFLAGAPDPERAGHGEAVVFAAQAKVPATRADREAVLVALSRTPGAVVKLRAATGEQQTHHEEFAYPDLWADLLAAGRVAPGSVAFAAGSMAESLAAARALVTVSSTAALEAMAADVPVLVVDDFGVSEEMINTVFEGSGCLGSLADVERGRFGRPLEVWRRDNYFHPPADEDAHDRLAGLLARRAAGPLPRPVRARGSLRTRVRRRVRLWPPVLLAQRHVRPLRTRLARGAAPGGS